MKLYRIYYEDGCRRIKRGTLRGDYFLADGQPLFTEKTVKRIRAERG